MGVKFESGDIIIETRTGDVGLLIERFDVLEHAELEEIRGRVFDWDIVWTGKNVRDYNRYTPYTESALVKCMQEGVVINISSS